MTLRTEFHTHTIHSKDSLTTREKLVETCRRKGIDRVVITDHNSIKGALRAYELDPARVIVGEEVMTTKGELLASFVTDEVPGGLSPQEALARLKDQDAFISVSHPFDRHRNGHWELPDLLEIINQVDAIETFNARCMLPKFNREAQAFAAQQGLPGTVGSDAHTVFEIGKATLMLPEFATAGELRQVIRQGQPLTSLSPPWIHLTSRYAVWYKKLTRRKA
jgi:predicted metal-dependent phosphoesterase TrpH